jgi:hypothetical protein
MVCLCALWSVCRCVLLMFFVVSVVSRVFGARGMICVLFGDMMYLFVLVTVFVDSIMYAFVVFRSVRYVCMCGSFLVVLGVLGFVGCGGIVMFDDGVGGLGMIGSLSGFWGSIGIINLIVSIGIG